MATKVNLHRNPALSVNDTNYFGTGWARTASAHASLPRTTAWAGNTTGVEPALGRSTTVPGKYYVLTFSVRAIATVTGALHMDWKTSGDAYLSTTSASGGSDGVVNMTSSSTRRFGMIGLAPATGERMIPVAADWLGDSQITAVMVRQFDTLPEAEAGLVVDLLPGNYFDGDTAGASWSGTTGLSTSTLIADDPLAGRTTWGAQTTAVTRTRDFGVGATIWGAQTTRTGLIPTVSWDPRRGRVRVTAVGLSADVVRVEVSSRAVGTVRWNPVRGGKVAVVDGRFERTVDDYEFVAGEGMQYRIQAFTTAENITPANVSQTIVASISDTLDQVWIKFIVAPHRNAKVSLIGWGPVSRRSRQAVFGIRNRPDPIVVTDVHASRSVTVQLMAWSEDEAEELDRSLSIGLPIYFQTPSNVQLRSMYASVGDYTFERSGGVTSPRSIFSIPLTEVSPPPLSIVGPGLTYSTLLEDFLTYEELADAYASYLEVIA